MGEDSRVGKSPTRVLASVLDSALETQWKRASISVDGHRRRTPNATPEEIAQRIVAEFVRDVSVIGAAGGAVAALPGPATAVKLIGGRVLETGALMERAAFMIMGVAEAYGLRLDEIEIRRYAVLRVVGAWIGVTQGATRLAGTLGAGLGKKATEAIPMSAIHAFNKAMRKQILFKWVSRAGAIRLGSALPFGIGAGIGGASNYFIGNVLGRTAIAECRPIGTELEDGGGR